MIPGEIFVKAGDITLNEGRKSINIKVVSTGDRPIQVGSHFHFFEVNKALEFDRTAAFGMRLNIPAGTAVRFEPGEEKNVSIVAIGGNHKIIGLNNLVNGYVKSVSIKKSAIAHASELHFKTTTK